MYKQLTPDQQGYTKFATGGVVIAVIGLALWVINELRPEFDDEMCLVDTSPPGHHVLFIDISELEDALTLGDVIRAKAEVLPQYHRLSVYIAGLTKANGDTEQRQGSSSLVRMFSACNPGRGDQVNPWIVGSQYAERRYWIKFGKPLDVVIKETAAHAGSKWSPIMSALALIPNIEHFGPEIVERSLGIRSDLLEHTPKYTQYTADIKTVSYALDQLGVNVPNLKGVIVHVDFVQRQKYVRWQTPQHQAWWDEYFQQAGLARVFDEPGLQRMLVTSSAG